MKKQWHTLDLCSSLSIPFPTPSHKHEQESCHYHQQEMSLHVGSYFRVEWESTGILQILHHSRVIKHAQHNQESYFQSVLVGPTIFTGHIL